jgi:hypothetical protein
MGNNLEKVNLVHENINVLCEIGKNIDDHEFDKEMIKTFYETFYYPKHSLTKLEEMCGDHPHLKNILKNHIKLFNKYNSTNIDESTYVRNTYILLKKTLNIIGV